MRRYGPWALIPVAVLATWGARNYLSDKIGDKIGGSYAPQFAEAGEVYGHVLEPDFLRDMRFYTPEDGDFEKGRLEIEATVEGTNKRVLLVYPVRDREDYADLKENLSHSNGIIVPPYHKRRLRRSKFETGVLMPGVWADEGGPNGMTRIFIEDRGALDYVGLGTHEVELDEPPELDPIRGPGENSKGNTDIAKDYRDRKNQ